MFSFRNDVAAAALIGLLITGCAETDAPARSDFSGSTLVPGTGLNGFFDCLEGEGVTLVAAHRGGTVENSIAGMEMILAEVPALMEVDVNVSADGVLFLMHDDTLERTTTGTGAIADRNWHYISTLTVEGPDGTRYDSPPTLASALAWAEGKTILELDIKRAVDYDDVVAAVKQAGATDRIIYIAYTSAQAEKLHRLHPHAMISATLDDPGDLDLIDVPADRLLGWTGYTEPDTKVFDELNAADVEVIFGTLGGRDSIDNRLAATGAYDYYADLARAGVDIIATDQPIAAYNAMKKAGLKTASPACGVIERE
ncbi:glycerophosphodiester phosphodiesterase family protein [Aquisalinus flavus]|uniref:glycerophosphodiester phosphodiesterase family protein n=1 Tax=Aquisalinus flavus TaxID=1526572 RepID=UPI00165EFAF9|nr:glycerophosphodiester phosphodiesterase family protein [Aquisalinus flavus]MBD0425595.1 glycerophosphodiester phosphodiesterase family protein [Aquisalinus flavus]